METKGWHKIFEKSGEAGAADGLNAGLEKASVDHPMDADALEGLESFSVTGAELAQLEQRLDAQLQGPSGASGVAGFNSLLLLLGIGIAGALAWAGWQGSGPNEVYAERSEAPYLLPNVEDPEVFKRAFVVLPNQAQQLEANQSMEVSSTHAPVEAPEIPEVPATREIWHLQPMTAKETRTVEVPPRKERLWKEAPDYRYEYLRNYKIYDYGGRRIALDKRWMMGLEPGYSHWKFSDEDLTPGDHYKPYLEILEQALLAFDKADYEKSLKHLNTILNAVDTDQNGLFYGAMAHYQLGEFDDSEKMLRKLLEEDSDVFRPEATWYLALNLLAQNKLDEAKEHLITIQSKNGFYSIRAEEQLSDLE